MKKDLRQFHFTLQAYTVVVVPTLLLLSAVFFYFYFLIPEKESSILFDFDVSAEVQKQTIDKRASTILEIHNNKVIRHNLLSDDIRDVFSLKVVATEDIEI